jgi:hypothetical protein
MYIRLRPILLLIFTVILFSTVLNWVITPIGNGDIFMYLSMGRFFLEQSFFPTQDPFLYLQGGGNHFHHEWLSYIFYFKVEHEWGLAGIIFVRMVLYAVLFAVPVLLAKKLNAFNFRTLGLLVLAIVSIASRVGDRAFVFSDLFTVILICALLLFDEKKDFRFLIGLPFIFLAWVQFHPGFPLGLLILSSYAFFRVSTLSPKLCKSLLISICLSFLVCTINPLGVSGFLYPFKIFFSPDWNIYRQNNSEWMPLLSSSYVADFSKITAGLLFVGSLVSSVFEMKKKNFFPVVLTLMMGYLAFSSMRFISIAPLVFTLICIAYPFIDLIKPVNIFISCLKPLLGVVSILSVVVLAVHVSQFEDQGFPFLFNDKPKVNAPMQAIQQLNFLEPGTVFAEWDWNSIICWVTAGKQKVVVHGHIDQPKFAVENFLRVGLSEADFDRVVEANSVRYFLLGPESLRMPNSVIFQKLQRPPWRILYSDNKAIIFGK